MTDQLPLPDQLEIKHGERMGEITPDAKQYYHPDEPAEQINNIHIQQFDYKVTLNEIERGVILQNIALDTENGTYYIFTHSAGINANHGLVSHLKYEVTIQPDGTRMKQQNQIPDKIIDAMRTYYENH